ncbi:hypothetical protein Pla52o_44920 [Novipirellula galeiformis]|uniref:Uncharacterized protein n=1 Tax=Novipirellula galeiformis TaxID=2528004 RepID=A0A5C6CB33_9BACT|nr:hypothetical protein [Novipirellula galeiformis]TWU20614.1 hypothetical protein Pla52o_44920 [Novipirellula galeiformis]
MRHFILATLAVSAMLITSEQAAAQWGHIDYVPHTQTHIDYYRHGNHLHAVPHTTTHVDPVYHNGPHYNSVPYQSRRPVIQYGQPQYRSGYRTYYGLPNGVQSTYRSTYPSTHIDYVPHTQTHIDYYRHGNHIDAVPHTTTHIDAVPHTTHGH